MPNPIELHAAEFANAMEHFEEELKSLRSGRANPAAVENIPVEAYGSTMEMKGVASISIPDAKTIQIEPWDKALVKDIEKALVMANLGMQPNVNGSTIRLSLPPMTEENRKRLVKQAHEMAEHARIAIRNIREKIRETILKSEKEKTIGEDEKFRLQEELEKTVKEWNGKIEQTVNAKEEEVMTI